MAPGYDAFLESSDLASWARCLDASERALGRGGDAGPPDPEQVVHGLTLSVYTQWLGAWSGDAAAERRAKAVYERFVEALRDLHGRTPSALTWRGWGVVLAWAGYRGTARDLLAGTGPLGPDLALLVVPPAHAERAALLRPSVRHSSGKVFPPALYFYGNALIDLGATREAVALLGDAGLGEANPLVCDLLGKVHERTGHWREAFEVYQRSGWPAHRYRAAMSRAILEGGGARADGRGALVVDEALQAALEQFDPEIDQAELARCTAFLNACLWNPCDHWLMRFELGKLNFRRRRYAEADAHLRKALALAPAGARPVIARLRFTNLTWLTGSSLSQDLSMVPEALESAYAALEAGAGDRESAVIRVWVAELTGERAVLPRDVGAWDPFWQAEAHATVGNGPEVLGCRLRSLRESFYHRNLVALIRTFSAARFEGCVDYLIDLTVRESADDFAALWELAGFLLTTRGLLSESSQGFERLSRRLTSVTDRLEELSQWDFQHLIRAHDFFAQTNRQDTAEALVRRAAKLAEGAAENLAIAIARRRAGGFNAAHGDAQGLDCLLRAERESRDRLERLQIARELFHYGRVQRARHLLEAEGVFAADKSFEPIEYTVILQCRRWLKPDEYQALAQRARAALAVALECRAADSYRGRYLARLAKTAGIPLAPPGPTAADRPADEGFAPRAEAVGLQDGDWKTWRLKVEEAVRREELEEERALFEAGASRVRAPSAFEVKVATWSWVNQQLEGALDEAATVRPKRDPSATPISKNLKLEDDWRALEVSDLWRSYLTAADPEAGREARGRLESFYVREEQLLAEWEALRLSEAERPLRRALFYGEFALQLLPTVVSQAERGETHPVLRRLYECVAADCARLAQRTADRVGAIRRDLSAPGGQLERSS